ncbi:hypothetical protein GCM10027340_18720 [Marinomonas epiphytica]
MTPTEHIKRRLKDYAPAKESSPALIRSNSERHSIPRSQFPSPNLLRFLLQGICQFPLGHPEEKMYWIIPFTYKGEDCAISNEKFGLYFYSVKKH